MDIHFSALELFVVSLNWLAWGEGRKEGEGKGGNGDERHTPRRSRDAHWQRRIEYASASRPVGLEGDVCGRRWPIVCMYTMLLISGLKFSLSALLVRTLGSKDCPAEADRSTGRQAGRQADRQQADRATHPIAKVRHRDHAPRAATQDRLTRHLQNFPAEVG